MFEPQIHNVLVQPLLVKFRPLPSIHSHHISVKHLLFHAFLFGDAEVVEGFLHAGRVEVEVDFLQLLVVADLLDVVAFRLCLLLGGACAQVQVCLSSSTPCPLGAVFPCQRLVLS